MDTKEKRFIPTVSLGSLIAATAFIASGVGIYTQVIADVNASKIEINNLKQESAKKEVIQETQRREARDDLKEVKQDVKELRNDISNVLYELRKIPKPPARFIQER